IQVLAKTAVLPRKVDVTEKIYVVVDRCRHRIDEVQELGGIDLRGIGDVDDIERPHIHLGGEEEPGGILEADAVDDWNDSAGKSGAVHPHSFGHVTRLAPVQEDRTRVCLVIEQALRLGHGLSQVDPPGVEIELALYAGGAEGEKLHRLAIDI